MLGGRSRRKGEGVGGQGIWGKHEIKVAGGFHGRGVPCDNHSNRGGQHHIVDEMFHRSPTLAVRRSVSPSAIWRADRKRSCVELAPCNLCSTCDRFCVAVPPLSHPEACNCIAPEVSRLGGRTTLVLIGACAREGCLLTSGTWHQRDYVRRPLQPLFAAMVIRT